MLLLLQIYVIVQHAIHALKGIMVEDFELVLLDL